MLIRKGVTTMYGCPGVASEDVAVKSHRARVQCRALRVTDLGHHALGHLVSISNDASLLRQLQALHSSRCVANPLHFSDLSINNLDRVSIQLSTGRRIVDVLR